MFMKRYLLSLILHLVACKATVSPDCFVKGPGPFGSNNGASFSDMDLLMSSKMTADMRV